MVDVGLDDTLEMAPRQDQQPVKTLGSDRSHPALGESVAPGARIGVRMISRPSPLEHLVEWAGNLLSRSRMWN